MGRTWLLRGTTVAIFGLLVGAWAVGLAGADDAASPGDKLSIPASPDSSSVPASERSTDRASRKPRRTRALHPLPDGLTDPSQVVDDPASDDPASDDPATPDPTSPDPSPTPQGPSQPPDSPPSPPPSNTPNQPDDECTDLGSSVDCALDPFTGGP